MSKLKVYIVTVQDSRGNLHVIEAFTNEAKSLEYNVEMSKLYDDLVTGDGWSVGYGSRVLDEECLNLTGLKEHQDKRKDPEWCARFNTIESVQELTSE